MADHTYTENEQSEGELILFLDVSLTSLTLSLINPKISIVSEVTNQYKQ
jgi:hypothetical protein